MAQIYDPEQRIAHFLKHWGDEGVLSDLESGEGYGFEGEDGMRGLLGLPTTKDQPHLTPQDIKTAYRRTARNTHPDTGTTPNPTHFNLATQAHETLLHHHTQPTTTHTTTLTPHHTTTGGTYTIKLPTGTTTIHIEPHQHHGTHHTPHGTIHHTTTLPQHQTWVNHTTIHHTLTLTFPEAAAGTNKRLPLLTRRAKLTIPPGTPHGTQFTLTHPDHPGITLRVTTHIKIPAITKEQATTIKETLKKSTKKRG